MGPCLTVAAPAAAPGALFVCGRYAEARTSSSAVIAANCVGGSMATSLPQEALTPNPCIKAYDT